MPRIKSALALSIATLATGFLAGACNDTSNPNGGNAGLTTTSNGLKIGTLLPTTGDLASIGQQMAGSVPLLVQTVNACDGVNGQPVTLVEVDDQTDPRACCCWYD